MARALFVFLLASVFAAPALGADTETLPAFNKALLSVDTDEADEADPALAPDEGLAARLARKKRRAARRPQAAPPSSELERDGDASDGQTQGGRAPPSRTGAFAGGYMAATGLGTLWVVNQVAWWGLVALSVVAPPLAPLAAGGLCTTSAVVCGMPVVQGLLVARLGDAMGGFDSFLGYLVAVGAAYASALVIGGGAVVAAVLLSQAITPWVGAPTTTTNGATRIDPLPFAAHASIALGLAAGAFLVQPLVPAALFAVSATTPGPFRQAWQDRRGDDDDDGELYDNEELYDDDDESYEVRAPPPGSARLASAQRF